MASLNLMAGGFFNVADVAEERMTSLLTIADALIVLLEGEAAVTATSNQ